MNLGITPRITTNLNQPKSSKQITFGLMDGASDKDIKETNIHNAVVRLLDSLIEINPERRTGILEQFRTFANSLPYGTTSYDLQAIARKLNI